MSLPVHLFNIQIVTDASMASDIESIHVNVDEAASFSIQAIFTGTPMGTLQIEGSNDVPNYDNIITNWTPISDSIDNIIEAGTYLLNVEFPVYSFVRLTYTRISGSGTLNARINAKRR